MSATQVGRRGPIAAITLANPPVNGLGTAVRAGLEAAFLVEEGALPRDVDGDPATSASRWAPLPRAIPEDGRTSADGVGLDVVADAMRRLESRHGARMAPAPLLNRWAHDGQGFKDL